MDNTLFPDDIPPEYLFDLKYKGPSFDGKMEIGVLINEISGLEDIINITTGILYKNKKIGFSQSDIEIFIEAFERGSFKKRVKLVSKTLNKNQGVITLACFIIEAISLIQQNNPKDINKMSPIMISQISDPVKIEMLQNKTFLSAASNIIMPLNINGDELELASPKNEQITVKHDDKSKFIALANNEVGDIGIEGDKIEILRGRINRVDLDATKRHLGFKVNGEGNCIPATISDQAKTGIDMKDLLGQWAEINTNTAYKYGVRDHMEVQSLKIITQQKMDF
jgi:hypothetical protein